MAFRFGLCFRVFVFPSSTCCRQEEKDMKDLSDELERRSHPNDPSRSPYTRGTHRCVQAHEAFANMWGAVWWQLACMATNLSGLKSLLTLRLPVATPPASGSNAGSGMTKQRRIVLVSAQLCLLCVEEESLPVTKAQPQAHPMDVEPEAPPVPCTFCDHSCAEHEELSSLFEASLKAHSWRQYACCFFL